MPDPDPAPPGPSAEGGSISLAEVEVVARDVERLLAAGEGFEALERYRVLGIGDDLERLARPLSASPAVAVTLWTMAIVDCAAQADQIAQARATDRLRLAFGRRPEAARIDFQTVVNEAQFVHDVMRAAMLNRDPRDLRSVDDARARKYLDPEMLEAMQALSAVRLLVPDLVIQRDADPEELWQPSEVRRRYDELVEPVRRRLGAMPRGLARRVREILRAVEGDLDDLDDGLVRLRCYDGASEAALLGAPDTSWWVRDDYGLVHVGARDRAFFEGGYVYLEIPRLSRYARVEIDIVGQPEPLFGGHVVVGSQIVAGAVLAPSVAASPPVRVGSDPITPMLLSVFTQAQQRLAGGGAMPRSGMIVRLENEGAGGLPAIYMNEMLVARAGPLPPGSPEGVVSYRIFTGPTTTVHQVRMFLAPR